jgi:uroporphyrinogen decarboxylase
VNRKEAVLKTICGEKTDYTPYHFDLTLKMTDRLGEYYLTDSENVEDLIGNHFLYLNYEGEGGSDTGYRDVMNEELFIDEFGVTWDASGNYDIGDWGLVEPAVKNLDFSTYEFPDGKGEGRFDNAVFLMKKFPGRLNTMMIRGPFVLGWNITGMEDFLMGMALEKKAIENVLDNATNYIVNIIKALPEGVDAVRIIDDWGTQTGLLFSKDMWRQFIYPRFETIGNAIREKGLVFMHHSCGNTTELFPFFINLGIDVFDAMQPEALDIVYIKKEYGKDITLFGGLGSQSTIPLGTPEDVVREAKETRDLLGEGGKYILGPAGSIPTDAPIENVTALIGYCKEQAGEPLDV